VLVFGQRSTFMTALCVGMVGLGALTGCGDRMSPAGAAVTSASTAPVAPTSQAEPTRTDEQQTGNGVEADIVYREVAGDQVRLDVCPSADSAELRPAVLLIHGGAFTAGDKDTQQWRETCIWLAEAGYVAINLNYRLAPEHIFPAAIEDIQAAVLWTRDNAATYGIDPQRVGVLGGSAGANLAQLLGAAGSGPTDQGARVSAVVSLSGAADLTERGLSLGEPLDVQIDRVLEYLGCAGISDCPAAAAASPITHVDPSDPAFLLVQSEQESLPVEQTSAMATALAAAGGNAEVLIQPGPAHAARLLDEETVRAAVLDFLARTLR